MTEGGSGGPPLTPEEEQVARLLAEAGGPVPMPGPVVDRLDRVIVELQAERSTDPEGSSADVVELRARRRWPRVLLAAAAVVIGGYAVGTVASQGTLSGSGESSTAASDSAGGATSESLKRRGADKEQDGDAGALAEGGVSAQEAPAGSAAPEAAEDRARMTLAMVRLRSDRLEAGVLRALRVLDSPSDTFMYLAPAEDRCPLPETSGGERTLPVRYDGRVAVLVADPEQGGTVQVTVYDCSGAVLDGTLVRP